MEDQDRLRAAVLTKRRELNAGVRASCSGRILEGLRSAWGRERLPRGLSIGLYRSMPDEVDLGEVALWLESEGCKLYFPRVMDMQQGRMEWVCARISHDASWKRGKFGILEPCESITGEPHPELSVVFVPGVAFGEAGERVGMGKGFYDRVLSRDTVSVRVALAFDFQIFPRIDQNPWDEKVHWIFTEKREIQACSLNERIGQLPR